MSYSELALGASNVLLGSAVGAGVNQSIFVMPQWFSSPPESLPRFERSRSFQAFWIPLQLGCGLALGSAWALNRGDPRRRPLLSLAAGLYAGTWAVTAAYFAPEILRLLRSSEQLGAEEVARRGKRWLVLTWGRHAALAGAWLLAAAAARVRPAPRPLRFLR